MPLFQSSNVGSRPRSAAKSRRQRTHTVCFLLIAVSIVSMVVLSPQFAYTAIPPPPTATFTTTIVHGQNSQILTLTSYGCGSPTYGTAEVDGNPSEWDLTNDFFTNMYRAFDPTKELQSTAYLRYDCSSHVMYVLVLVVDPFVIDTSNPTNHWVKIDGIPGNVVDAADGDDGTPPDFAFILQGTVTIGWEASFSLDPGSYGIIIHTQVFDAGGASQTSGTPGGLDDPLCVTVTCLTTTSTTTSTTSSTTESTFSISTTSTTSTTETSSTSETTSTTTTTSTSETTTSTMSTTSSTSSTTESTFSIPTTSTTTTSETSSSTTSSSSQRRIWTVLSASVITFGQSVHDSAFLSGVTPDAGGTVTYTVYDDPYCSEGHIVFTSIKTVTNGIVPDSDPFTPTAVGIYQWLASYSGDAKNAPAVDACGSEPLEVRSGDGQQQPPVGGDVYAPNKLVLLKPYLALLGLLGAVAAGVAITRGRRP